MGSDHGVGQEYNLKWLRNARSVWRRVKQVARSACRLFQHCQSKHFTTGGEDGMVITNDDDLGLGDPFGPRPWLDVKER